MVICDMLRELRSRGYFTSVLPGGLQGPARFVLETASALGELYVPDGCEPREPLIRTVPTRETGAAPFDRPEAIGWHGDFASHEDRPELSLVYVTRGDPRGAQFGAWRLASVSAVLQALNAFTDGRAAIEFLRRERLPFSYRHGEAPRWFRVIETQTDGELGLRFYLPSIRRGCVAAYGCVPQPAAAALKAVERAADRVAHVVPTIEGSFLVASNWFALHDRTQQTVSDTTAAREALLCFVAHTNLYSHEDTLRST